MQIAFRLGLWDEIATLATTTVTMVVSVPYQIFFQPVHNNYLSVSSTESNFHKPRASRTGLCPLERRFQIRTLALDWTGSALDNWTRIFASPEKSLSLILILCVIYNCVLIQCYIVVEIVIYWRDQADRITIFWQTNEAFSLMRYETNKDIVPMVCWWL